MTPNLAPIALTLLLLLLLPWPHPAGAVSPRLLQECPGPPPANGSLLLMGNPPVKVTLGYLTAVTGTMNNRQVGAVNAFVISLFYILVSGPCVKANQSGNYFIDSFKRRDFKDTAPEINQGICY